MRKLFSVGNICLPKRADILAKFRYVRFDEQEDMLREFFYKRALEISEKPLLSISRDGTIFTMRE
jgi:hypothetical protein